MRDLGGLLVAARFTRRCGSGGSNNFLPKWAVVLQKSDGETSYLECRAPTPDDLEVFMDLNYPGQPYIIELCSGDWTPWQQKPSREKKNRQSKVWDGTHKNAVLYLWGVVESFSKNLQKRFTTTRACELKQAAIRDWRSTFPWKDLYPRCFCPGGAVLLVVPALMSSTTPVVIKNENCTLLNYHSL